MIEAVNRQWLLAGRPEGMVRESDFAYHEAKIPSLKDGQFLVRNLYLAFEPAMRGWMEDRESYIPPVSIGEVMRALTVGQIVQSRNDQFPPGECVYGAFGWQEYAVARETGGLISPSKIPANAELTWPLGVLGVTGLSAYFGMLDIGKPKRGEICIVSGAAGATGSVAGQIAKIKGCRVIGIAGGESKCRWLIDDAGYDAAIDYKAESVEERIEELCPTGVDLYFDNVGGSILDAVLERIANRARIVLCGGISSYNEQVSPPGPKNYMNLVIRRGRMEGFIVTDYASEFVAASAQLGKWVSNGDVVFREDIQEGFENAPRTFLRLFEGKNFGKQLLQIGELDLGRS